MASQSVGRIAAFTPDAKEAHKAVKRIFNVLNRAPKIRTNEGILPETPFSGKLTFKNLRFSYPTRPEVGVLEDFTCSIQPGMQIALVGQSGCGKSTILQLIQRFYDSTNNEMDQGIFFDQYNAKELAPKWIRKQIGIVAQEPTLFDLSLRDNIAFGDTSREVPMDEIIEAAKMANIHDFIISLPEGYETKAGQGGSQLSGGQKQRIAIARALIRKPQLLLLDEATSALDSENERIVQDALDVAMVSRTSVIVAHRLSTVRNADHIIVFSKGKIIESGSPDDLMKIKGAFYHLYHAALPGSTA